MAIYEGDWDDPCEPCHRITGRPLSTPAHCHIDQSRWTIFIYCISNYYISVIHSNDISNESSCDYCDYSFSIIEVGLRLNIYMHAKEKGMSRAHLYTQV